MNGITQCLIDLYMANIANITVKQSVSFFISIKGIEFIDY